jgi:tripartite-type tricarboxylate transporter receptor subunit TctC
MVGKSIGIDMQHVAYKGGAPLHTDLIGGQIPVGIDALSDCIEQHRGGRLRIVATSGSMRSPLLPDVPTFKELGVDWVDGAFRGIGVPKSTPPEVRRRLSELFAALNADPQMKDLAAKAGFELVNVGLDGMDTFMRTRTKVYSDVGKRMGLGGTK